MKFVNKISILVKGDIRPLFLVVLAGMLIWLEHDLAIAVVLACLLGGLASYQLYCNLRRFCRVNKQLNQDYQQAKFWLDECERLKAETGLLTKENVYTYAVAVRRLQKANEVFKRSFSELTKSD